MSYFFAALLRPIFWLVVLWAARWLVRRLLPAKWEKILFIKIPQD